MWSNKKFKKMNKLILLLCLSTMILFGAKAQKVKYIVLAKSEVVINGQKIAPLITIKSPEELQGSTTDTDSELTPISSRVSESAKFDSVEEDESEEIKVENVPAKERDTIYVLNDGVVQYNSNEFRSCSVLHADESASDTLTIQKKFFNVVLSNDTTVVSLCVKRPYEKNFKRYRGISQNKPLRKELPIGSKIYWEPNIPINIIVIQTDYPTNIDGVVKKKNF